MRSSLLGGLTKAAFLKTHWQKKPLFVRQAFTQFVDPLSPDELAGLSMEPDIKARLIFEKGVRPWRLCHGPFTESRLRRLPRSHWSLLVSRVNEYSVEAARLLDHFSFIPNWRLEDLMVSFAPPQGTVGAHIDSYDVFLIQGQGRRRWQIELNPDPTLVPDLDLKILKRFKPDAEWVLEPGDMLYLPPGVAHYGVALEDCMTYSVGFRAPSFADVWQDLYQVEGPLRETLTQIAGDRLYADPDLKMAEQPGLLAPDAVAIWTKILREPLQNPEIVSRWMAAYLTRPLGEAPPRSRALKPAAVELQLAKSDVLRSDEVRMMYLPPETKHKTLFVGGEEHRLDTRLLPLVQSLCAKRVQTGQDVLKALPKGHGSRLREGALTFLAELLAQGAIELHPI